MNPKSPLPDFVQASFDAMPTAKLLATITYLAEQIAIRHGCDSLVLHHGIEENHPDALDVSIWIAAGGMARGGMMACYEAFKDAAEVPHDIVVQIDGGHTHITKTERTPNGPR